MRRRTVIAGAGATFLAGVGVGYHTPSIQTVAPRASSTRTVGEQYRIPGSVVVTIETIDLSSPSGLLAAEHTVTVGIHVKNDTERPRQTPNYGQIKLVVGDRQHEPDRAGYTPTELVPGTYVDGTFQFRINEELEKRDLRVVLLYRGEEKNQAVEWYPEGHEPTLIDRVSTVV